MDTITLKAYAKLNLTLGVLFRRADGYHALDMLMQGIDLFDTVTVSRAREIHVTASGAVLPYDNTLKKAAEVFFDTLDLKNHGAEIRVIKRIPSEAGMGGGSADAAAVFEALQQLYGEPDNRTLYDMALRVGADVPFCLYLEKGGSIARAEGIGERLTPLHSLPMAFVVLKPTEGVSTGKLFSSLTFPRRSPETMRAIAAVGRQDLPALASFAFNALEAPAVTLVPEIGTLIVRLKNAGALGACMTGSGSAVFGVFSGLASAKAALETFSDVPFAVAVEGLTDSFFARNAASV